MPPTARQLAFDTLAQWRQLESPPFLPERSDPAWAGAPVRERALAFELITGVLRHRLALEAVIGAQLRQAVGQLDVPVQAVLWLGAYQLLLHESARTYAVVHSAVELAKRNGLARASGLVNAVLRGITRLKSVVEIRHGLSADALALSFNSQLRFNRAVFPDPGVDHIAYLVAAYSHPRALVERLIAAHGEPAAIDILLHNCGRPPVLVRADRADWKPLAALHLGAHEEAGYFVADKGWNPAIEAAVERGEVSPQDPTAGRPVGALAEWLSKHPPRHPPTDGPVRILDLCAGLGTKTIQLARAFPQAQVFATDVNGEKLRELARRAARMGLGNVHLLPLEDVGKERELEIGNRESEIGKQHPEMPSRFNAVLVDVPCSNTGVMSRRVQARWRWPGLDREGLARLQLGLLGQGAGLLAEGRACVVYSTCSIDPAENGEVVGRLLATHAGRGMSVQEERLTLPSAGDAAAQYHDGGYYAVLGR